MELESKYKELLSERDKYKYENNALKSGLKDMDRTKDVIDTSYLEVDAVANNLEKLKRKNASLKRENELIRRELESIK